MSALIPFTFEGVAVRVIEIGGEPWFVGKDVAERLGYANPTDAMNQHCKGVAKRYPLSTAGGMQEVRILSEPDVLRLIVGSKLPAAERFEKWVFEEVLPAIRKTGNYGIRTQTPPVMAAVKFVPLVVRAARALGLDKNAAAISANQLVTKLTGANVLHLLGHTHLTAEDQNSLYFTPTELGERLGCSARKVNLLIADAGLQTKNGDYWTPLEAAQGFYRILDTGKRHGDGTMIQQIKWSERLLPFLQEGGRA